MPNSPDNYLDAESACSECDNRLCYDICEGSDFDAKRLILEASRGRLKVLMADKRVKECQEKF